MRNWLHSLLAAGMIATSVGAQADTYPTRPITIIVPFAAGSGTDAVTRIIAPHLGAALKQTVVVENRPGANGALAAAYVARAAPDGYTLLMSTNSPHSAAPSLNKTLGYDPAKDFASVTRVGSFTLMLVANPQVPVNSVRELIAHVKANPGKLSYATGNTSGIVAGATLARWAGHDLLHVPYKSTPPAISDTIAGRVALMFVDLTPGLPHVRSGALRALAVTRLKRSALVPDIPSLHEEGVTDFEVDAWAGLFAPAGTPREITHRLNAQVRRIIEDPEVKARIAAIGFETISSTPEELDEFVRVQLAKWTKMIKDAGIEPE